VTEDVGVMIDHSDVDHITVFVDLPHQEIQFISLNLRQ
jgi:hypothetical protein